MTEADTLILVSRRRDDVLRIVKQAEQTLAEAKAELADLDVTGRTIARLRNAKWPPAGEAIGEQEKDAEQRPAYRPHWSKIFEPASIKGPAMTSTEMILDVLNSEHELADLFDGLSPKEVALEASTKFKHDVKPGYFSTTMWRMWQRGQLERIVEGRYRLPKKNPADAAPAQEASTGSDPNPAQGGEARPGGGT